MTLTYFQKISRVVNNFGISKMLLGFQWDGYLDEIGWINSFKLKKPVGKENEPLPWVTYSFIDFITGRLDKTMTVLEYGSGNSTLFYGRLVKNVYTVEHDEEWYKQIASSVPTNVAITYMELTDGKYAGFAKTIPEKVDMVVVDGRDRVNCIKQSADSLSSRGILVLDDSQRPEYDEGVKFLLSRGFKKIDFWGIAPGIFYRKCTSIFYHQNNCIGI